MALMEESKKIDLTDAQLSILNLNDVINYILGKKDYIINYEHNLISKSEEDVERELSLLESLSYLHNEFSHLRDKTVVIIPPKYELWVYLCFSFVLLFSGLKVVFVYHDWASEVIKGIFIAVGDKNVIFNNLQYVHIDNVKDQSWSDHIILNFYDDIDNINKNVPNFSTGVICHDVDLDYTINYVLSSVKYFAGLSKSSLKRLIVNSSIYDEFLSRMRSKFNLLTGSVKSKVISKNFKDTINELYSSAIADGADILIGGNIYSDDLEMTVFTDVNMDMRIYQKDFFGPFLLILKTESTDSDIESLLSLQPSDGILLFTKDTCSFVDNLPDQQNKYKFLKRPNKFDLPLHDLLDAYPSLEYALKLIS